MEMRVAQFEFEKDFFLPVFVEGRERVMVSQ